MTCQNRSTMNQTNKPTTVSTAILAAVVYVANQLLLQKLFTAMSMPDFLAIIRQPSYR